MAKINIEASLFERATSAAQKAGYSSVEEFVAHSIENELQKLKLEEAETDLIQESVTTDIGVGD